MTRGQRHSTRARGHGKRTRARENEDDKEGERRTPEGRVERRGRSPWQTEKESAPLTNTPTHSYRQRQLTPLLQPFSAGCALTFGIDSRLRGSDNPWKSASFSVKGVRLLRPLNSYQPWPIPIVRVANLVNCVTAGFKTLAISRGPGSFHLPFGRARLHKRENLARSLPNKSCAGECGLLSRPRRFCRPAQLRVQQTIAPALLTIAPAFLQCAYVF